MQLDGKVVFITGGAQGFGRGVAEAVLKKGGKVCLADVKQEQGEATADALKKEHGDDRVLFVKCDVTNASVFEGAFKTAVSHYGSVDVMCNNAGIMDERIWEKEVDINFIAVVRGTNMALDHMRTDKGGKGGVIINTASMAGVVPTLWFPVYSATKSAVHHFTTCWATNPEVKAAGVRCVSICPTGAPTALLDLAEDQIINLANFKESMEKTQYCTVDQVVEAYVRSMEDDSINGELMCILGKEGIVKMKMSFGPADAPQKPNA